MQVDIQVGGIKGGSGGEAGWGHKPSTTADTEGISSGRSLIA